MNEPQAYINGHFVPAAQAVVPVYDSGFVLGAAVSEQLRSFGGRVFRLQDHLNRLWRSLAIVGVEPPSTEAEFAEVAQRLVTENYRFLQQGDDLGLSIFVTPGPYRTLAGDAPKLPTVAMHTYPLPFGLWAKKYQQGDVLVTTDVVQVPPDCWPPQLKCRSRMHYYLADRQARQKDPDARALLLDQQGAVCETSTANVLLFDSAMGLVSPPAEKVLPGISLAMVAELAEESGISLTHRPLQPQQLATAEEVLLCATSSCLLPVTRFNGKPVGSGQPGPVFARLLSAWSRRVGLDIVAQAMRFADRC